LIYFDSGCFKIIKFEATKSPGLDGVNNRLLKNLPRKGVVYLTQLINACLNLSYFPTAWNKTNIIPILKPGKALTVPQVTDQ
jgi:hypothetical protein